MSIIKSMKKIFLAIIFLMILTEQKVEAHPHVFINYKINTVFSKKDLSGIKMTWGFDDMTSSMMFEDFDKNKDGKFDTSEVQDIKNQSMGNMKKFDYFIQFKINDKPLSVKSINNFYVSINNHLITYSFFIDYKIPVKKNFQKVSISLWDKTNYVAFEQFKNPITYKLEANIICQDMNKQNSSFNESNELIFKFKEK